MGYREIRMRKIFARKTNAMWLDTYLSFGSWFFLVMFYMRGSLSGRLASKLKSLQALAEYLRREPETKATKERCRCKASRGWMVNFLSLLWCDEDMLQSSWNSRLAAGAVALSCRWGTIPCPPHHRRNIKCIKRSRWTKISRRQDTRSTCSFYGIRCPNCQPLLACEKCQKFYPRYIWIDLRGLSLCS